MPTVASLAALRRAVADFAVTDLGLTIEADALAAARGSLDSTGLLLLGEVHGVRENPLIIRALLRQLGITSLALEWYDGLTATIRDFLASGTLGDHPVLWSGDGRITAGHLAVLAERSAAGALDLVLFDGITGADWTWTQRDEAMAGSVLAAAGPGTRTLVVAGNAHTPTRPSRLGVPLGAHLDRRRPGVREIRINYVSGSFYNCEPRQFRPSPGLSSHVCLYQHGEALILDLPAGSEAVVPHQAAQPAP